MWAFSGQILAVSDDSRRLFFIKYSNIVVDKLQKRVRVQQFAYYLHHPARPC